MAHDVFISHSVKDKTTADALCATLESEGVRCWIAPRDVVPGMEWGKSIIDAIKQARVMVLVFTANANASPQIRREVERAVNHDVVILPFRVENVIPDESLEYFIGNVHWLDALTPPIEAHFRSLAKTIKVLLAQLGPRVGRVAPVAAMQTEDAWSAPISVAGVPRPAVRPFEEARAHPAEDKVPVLAEGPSAGSGVPVWAPARSAPITASQVMGSAAQGPRVPLPHPLFTFLLAAAAAASGITTAVLVAGLFSLGGSDAMPTIFWAVGPPVWAVSVVVLAACVRSLRKRRSKQ